MAFITGLIGLGTSIVSGAIVEPTYDPAYSRQPITFDQSFSGTTLNIINATFGPVGSSGWGTLSVFQVFDSFGDIAFNPGTLYSPIQPLPGALVSLAAGQVSLTLNSPLTGQIAPPGYQSAIPAASAYPSGAFLLPPAVAGGAPGYSTSPSYITTASTTTTGTTSGSVAAFPPLPNQRSAYFGNGSLVAQNTSTGAGASWTLACAYERSASGVAAVAVGGSGTITSVTSYVADAAMSGCTVSLVLGSSGYSARVTGVSGATINWFATSVGALTL